MNASLQFNICSFLSMLSLILVVACLDGECRTLMFPSFLFFADKRLVNHTIRTERVPDLDTCEFICYQEPNCVSINFNIQGSDDGIFSCELNNATHQRHDDEFVDKAGYLYRGSESACEEARCENGGTCQSGFTDKKYRCLCPSGFTGENCKNDIDECGNGSHDCHENAKCINTAGHFNCSCQPGFTGDGRNCSFDCSSNFHHFEKYQDLPTRGARAVEQFSINGSLFLAFANYKSDTEGHNTDSVIYKMNDSTGKFFLYQTIGTTGGRNMKYFAIADRHYLAVANRYNGTTYRLNSVIYQWDGQRFVFFQNIATIGATSFNFFKIIKDMFLAVTNSRDGSTGSINSIVYKWNNNKFETFQEIRTEYATASAAFVINNKTYIVFASYNAHAQRWHFPPSTVFKWSGQQFVKLSSLQTYGARNVKPFNINGHTFLAFTNSNNGGGISTIKPSIYKRDGEKFVFLQYIPIRGAKALHPFVMCGQTYLGVAKYYDDSVRYNTKSVVYQASGSQFSEYQKISTQGAIDMTSFEYKGYTYLAVANHKNDDGKKNINSTLYKWI